MEKNLQKNIEELGIVMSPEAMTVMSYIQFRILEKHDFGLDDTVKAVRDAGLKYYDGCRYWWVESSAEKTLKVAELLYEFVIDYINKTPVVTERLEDDTLPGAW